MSPTLLLPLGAAVAATVLGGISQRYLRPAHATWSLTLMSTLSAVATVSGLAMVLVSFVHVAPWLGETLAWCLHVQHRQAPTPWIEGGISIGWLGLAAVRVQRCREHYKALAPADRSRGEVEVLASTQPMAYTLPGRFGRIVVSDGMLRPLSQGEREVLLAHERSHLRHRHDLFVHAAELAVAVAPPLGLMSKRVRYATERWADEDAVALVGDRRLVARALTRAALVQQDGLQPGLSLARLGVRARVEQLLRDPAPPSATRTAVLIATVLTTVALAGSSLQVHHLAVMAEHLCGWG